MRVGCRQREVHGQRDFFRVIRLIYVDIYSREAEDTLDLEGVPNRVLILLGLRQLDILPGIR